MFLYPRGYYSGCGFLKVPGDAFIWRRFFIYYPCGYYLGYGFTKIPGDVFIPPMCTIQQHRVHLIMSCCFNELEPRVEECQVYDESVCFVGLVYALVNETQGLAPVNVSLLTVPKVKSGTVWKTELGQIWESI